MTWQEKFDKQFQLIELEDNEIEEIKNGKRCFTFPLKKEIKSFIQDLLQEVGEKVIKEIEEEDDWLEMHKVESKFESGKIMGIVRAKQIAIKTLQDYGIDTNHKHSTHYKIDIN